ncbi:hypothetical protein N7491_008426, partial [Penicillium cf. griseofulvum]
AIYNNFEGQTKNLSQDLQCTLNATMEEQTAICSAYEEFGMAQLSYLHVADGGAFYEKNGHGDNAVMMHGYILQAQDALQNYTAQVKEAAPSCAGRIDTRYTLLGKQLQSLLQAYYPERAKKRNLWMKCCSGCVFQNVFASVRC